MRHHHSTNVLALAFAVTHAVTFAAGCASDPVDESTAEPAPGVGVPKETKVEGGEASHLEVLPPNQSMRRTELGNEPVDPVDPGDPSDPVEPPADPPVDPIPVPVDPVLPPDPVPSGPAHPFGKHHTRYASDARFPSGDRAQLDETTARFYDAWKQKYVRFGCGTGRAYVDVSIDAVVGGGKQADSLTVSEVHGYGMILTATFAGHDPQARTLFDAFYRFFRDHPGEKSPDTMSWNPTLDCGDSPKGTSSATDGDLDIAYSLLLAHAQWGSGGEIDYLGEARKVAAAIGTVERDPVTHLPTLGDFVIPGYGKHGAVARPSDLMVGHFRAFVAAGDASWASSVDASLSLVERVQTRYAPASGLVSDFVIDTRTEPRPPPGKWLENDWDGAYFWNACRVPMRLGTDWLVSGDPRTRRALERMNRFLREKTGGDPTKIDAGYFLDGQNITPRILNETGFLAPFGVAAMSDPTGQAWLDAIWTEVAARGVARDNHYGTSLQLMSMVMMSGNWLAPNALP